jgi:F0F1-type ATP synthase delta subunit
MNTITDPTMLGGFCVTFDNSMYDARIRTQIAKLLKEFSKNVYEKSI